MCWKKNKRFEFKIIKFQNHLKQIKHQIKSITEENLIELLTKANVTSSQCEMVKEIYLAAKVKNQKIGVIMRIGCFYACYFK